MSRTNYFNVKDDEKFETFLNKFDVEYDNTVDGYVMFSDEGNWPSSIYNEETNEYDDYDRFFDDVAEHLEDDEVVIVMTSGHEKMRYITGNAFAINSKGETFSIDINTIYEMVSNKWNVKPTLAEY